MVDSTITIGVMGVGFDKVISKLDKLSKAVDNAGNTARNAGTKFRMEFLSMMFFGAQIQKTFTGIAKQGVDSMMKIVGTGLTPASFAVIALSANLEFLKFTIGNALGAALEAILPTIISIIEKITDWIDKHPKLTGFLIIAGIAVGFLMKTIGALKLGIDGLKMVLGPIGRTMATTSEKFYSANGTFQGTHQVVGGLGNAFKMLFTKIIPIIAIAFLLYEAWKTNFLNIRQIVGTVVASIAKILKFIKPVLDWVVAYFIYWFFTLKSVLESLQDVVDIVWNTIVIIINSAVIAIVGLIRLFITPLEAAINGFIALGNVFGANWEPIRITEQLDAVIAGAADNIGKSTDKIVKSAMKIGDTFGKNYAEAGKFTETVNKKIGEGLDQLEAFGEEQIKIGEQMNKEREAGTRKDFGAQISEDIEKLMRGDIGGVFGIGGAPEIKTPEVSDKGWFGGGGVTTGDITVNVETGGVNDNIDIDAMADKISEKMMDEMRTKVNPAGTKFMS